MAKKGVRSRATSKEEKNERTVSLIAAAKQLFESKDYDDISTAAIADRAGLAKGTLFLYFKTKESLFLQVLSLSMKEWFTESRTIINRSKKTPQAVAKAIASTLVAKPDLVRLLALLHPVLERNKDAVSLLHFKETLVLLTNETATLFEEALGLKQRISIRTVLWMHALIIGLAQTTTPPKMVRTTLEQTDLAILRRDFETELELALRAFLTGISLTDGGTKRAGSAE